jgi:hypothetical protein
MTATLPVSVDELPMSLADHLDGSYLDLDRRPLLAVLDTSCVRTGLHFQIKNGSPPKSVTSARDGLVRLYMEYDTLVETGKRLPRFARQFGVSVAELTRVLNEDWLPHINVVSIPPSWREIDSRALAVRKRDADDYPAAALAALLSPCILLTRNVKDFGALGVGALSQGVSGVVAAAKVEDGQARVRAVALIPALPIQAAGATVKWALQRFGSATWLAIGLLVAGGVYLYLDQAPERRERIKKVAAGIGTHLLEQYAAATAEVRQARAELVACLVPEPVYRSPASAMLRELALSYESLSAQQLAELIKPELRPAVADLRAQLRANDKTLFAQVRRGGFVLGRRYELPYLEM